MFPPEPVPLKAQLRKLVEEAKNKPAHKAYEKAEKYIIGQATRGYPACTLPPINDHNVARYVADKFEQAGLEVSLAKLPKASQWLLKVVWGNYLSI